MIIYLAGGYSVLNNKGQERRLLKKFKRWCRLYSYIYFLDDGKTPHAWQIFKVLNYKYKRRS